MNLYMVFTYGENGFNKYVKIASELTWQRISEGYFKNKLNKRKQILTWYLADTRDVDSIKYSELNLLDDAIVIDENCRESDATELRREFVIRKLAGI